MGDSSNSFVFYASFYEAIKDLDAAIQVEIYTAISELALYGNTVEVNSPVARMAMTLIAPQIEANTRRRENGKSAAAHGTKGGRPPKTKNPIGVNDGNPIGVNDETPLGLLPKTPNVNVNVNVNDNVNVNEEKKKDIYINNIGANRSAPPAAESVCDKRIVELNNMLASEFGRTLSAIEYQTLQHWAAGYSDELIREAIRRAVLQGARSMKYIDTILVNWQRQGLKTLNDVEQYDKKPTRSNPGKKAEPAKTAKELEREKLVRSLYVN